MSSNGHAHDAMVRRLETEVDERSTHAQGIIRAAQDEERDLNETELSTLANLRGRTAELRLQIEELAATSQTVTQTRNRLAEIDSAIVNARAGNPQDVDYRSAGAWAVDMWAAHIGDRAAQERLETYNRAAAHQKTSDNAGVVPTPVVGGVINFIDAARPIVTALGPMPMPSQNWYRPLVTQQPTVGVQGSAGAAADEKSELTSQKMLISRLTATAVTYGGYVNVSRQDIDFSTPQIMDIVIEGLAAAYALQTETATGTALDASTGTPVGYGASPTAVTISAAIWSAAATVYTATKGQGRVILAVAPDRLAVFGPLFLPVNPQSSSSQGLFAGDFAQGRVGGISGIDLVMSAGLASTKAFLFSTAAMDVFEQRVGALQITEPSVLGVQVAYAGYFTPLLISNNGIIELTAT